MPIAGAFDDGTRLNNGGETIKLEDPSNNTIAEFRYRSEAPWPTVTDGSSLEYGSGLPSDGESWRSSASPGGTPNQHASVSPESDLIAEAFGTSSPTGRLVPSETGFVLSYPMVASESFTFRLETSPDLQDWSLADSMATIDESQTLTFHLSKPLPSASYVRVLVEKSN